MIYTDRVIVVEGKYDRIALSRIVDGIIVETGGFGIFSDDEKLQTLRTLAREKGLILLTDSDRSGMAIRNYLIGAIGPEYIRNAYIPDQYGKEKRKNTAQSVHRRARIHFRRPKENMGENDPNKDFLGAPQHGRRKKSNCASSPQRC